MNQNIFTLISLTDVLFGFQYQNDQKSMSGEIKEEGGTGKCLMSETRKKN